MLLHVAGTRRFNANLGESKFNNISVHWWSYLVNQSPYSDALLEIDTEQSLVILTDVGIIAAYVVTSGYAFNLRRQRRSLSETRFYYEYVMGEDQNSVEDTALKTLAMLPERFFVDAYAAATAFRLDAELEEKWSYHHDRRWVRRR